MLMPCRHGAAAGLAGGEPGPCSTPPSWDESQRRRGPHAPSIRHRAGSTSWQLLWQTLGAAAIAAQLGIGFCPETHGSERSVIDKNFP